MTRLVCFLPSCLLSLVLQCTILAHAQTFEPDAVTLSLPTVSGTTEALADVNSPVLLPLSPTGQLITLTRLIDGGSTYVPVGRSYDGHDWESVAGPEEKLQYLCDGEETERKCQVYLRSDADFTYYLTMHNRSVSPKNEIARFLERVSFGPTKDELNSWNYTNVPFSMATYIKDQIENVQTTLHREYFIRRYLEKGGGPKACEPNSVWRRFVFLESSNWKTFTIVPHVHYNGTHNDTGYVLSQDGRVLTVLAEPLHYYKDRRYWLNNEIGGTIEMEKPIQLCEVKEFLGSPFASTSPTPDIPRTLKVMVDGQCKYVVGGNPEVNLDPRFVDPNTLQFFVDMSELNSSTEIIELDNGVDGRPYHVLIKQDGIDDADCDTFPDPMFADPAMSVFAKLPDGKYAIQDYKRTRIENSIQNPALDGNGNFLLERAKKDSSYASGPVMCGNRPRTPFNGENCKLSYETNVCSAPPINHDRTKFTKALTLNSETLLGMNTLSGRYAHAVDGLRFDDTNLNNTNENALVVLPCDYKQRSRWIKVNTNECTQPSVTVQETTESQLAKWIYASNDHNPEIKDVYFMGKCHEDDAHKAGMNVFVEPQNQCYRNVHPDHLSVFDVNNVMVNSSQTIFNTAHSNETGILTLSSSVQMEWYELNHEKEAVFGKHIGRYGDSIKYNQLPQELQMTEIENSPLNVLKIEETINKRGGTIVCGSEGDVGSDVTFADDPFESDHADAKQTIWSIVAITAPDQLRQKMAWTLSQIITLDNLGFSRYNSDAYLQFYDIFVRNALGNYRDVLREIAYNPQMGEFLSYINNRAITVKWHSDREILHPDENFAREVMQLFSIGLVDLNLDGSNVIDKSGSPIKSYNPDDIVSFARTWTGFTNSYGWNKKDPLSLTVQYRDLWPKRGLEGKYIGDRYPLCVDLPERAFLKIGAEYHLLGGKSIDDREKRVVLDFSSDLYTKLCSYTNGACNFAATVTLNENLDCGDPQSTICKVDTISVIQVAPGVFYRYFRPPCIQLAVYDDAKKVTAGGKYKSFRKACGNPRMPIATTACCGLHDGLDLNNFFLKFTKADRPCEYKRERLTYLSNVNRCTSLGGFECDFEEYEDWSIRNSDCIDDIRNDLRLNTDQPMNNLWSWTTGSCSLKIAVEANGLVAVVHDSGATTKTAPFVDVNETVAYFSVHWEKNDFGDEQYPSIGNACGNGSCVTITAHGEQKCLCDIVLSEKAAFSTIPSREQALSELHIGAFPPELFRVDDYDLIESDEHIEVYRKANVRPPAAPPAAPPPASSDLLWGKGWLPEHGAELSIESRGVITAKGPSDFWGGLKIWLRQQNFAGKTLKIRSKVKLLGPDATGNQTVECDPGKPRDCPYIRISGQHYYDAISKWNSGDWNDILVTHTFPDDYKNINVYVLTALGNASFAGEAAMTIKDVEYSLLDTPGILTVSPAPSMSPSESLPPSAHTDYSIETIFKTTDEHGGVIYLKNVKSTVILGGLYEIRNPPNIMDPLAPADRDAYYETEAVIDHLLYHKNTAPFLSKAFIKFFGISNPSPRYIKTVATAFQTGIYRWVDGSSTLSYGDGEWGNLAATVAAITLDREATSVVLDDDPTYGSLRQPANKLISVMKSMEYTRAPSARINFAMTSGGGIGQFAYRIPTVFSFFRPDYSPPGQFARASLVSPESEILHMGPISALTNGLHSLINSGLIKWDGGLGSSPLGTAVGYLGFSPGAGQLSAEDVVDELATLLTSGRLSPENRLAIIEKYKSASHAVNNETALRVAQQLICVTPEFHSTNTVRQNFQTREVQDSPELLDVEDYKAIVYVYLFGGMDSFYMLSPDINCSLYPEYDNVRQEAKLKENQMLSINASTSDQICDSFGLHEGLPAFKQIYDSGDAIFFANTGHLSKPVTGTNWKQTKGQLFSHFHMMQEIQFTDPFRKLPSTGVMGRMLDVLRGNNNSVASIGIDTSASILAGQSTRQFSIGGQGPPEFYPKSIDGVSRNSMLTAFDNVNNATALNSGFFGNHWSQMLVDSKSISILTRTALSGVETSVDMGGEFQTVARLIKARNERKVNRDVFFIFRGGFDTHQSMTEVHNEMFPHLNDELDKFHMEMESQGMWKNVTLVLASEFGRAIAPNGGLGTDHGWGGNYFMMGGSVKGGRVLGKYPTSFKEGEHIMGGKFIIPTTSWDAVWNGIGQWFGVTEENDLNHALPNRLNFGCDLYTKADLFDAEESAISGLPWCGGDVFTIVQTFGLGEQRYFELDEEAALCDIFVERVVRATNSSVVCNVDNQEVAKQTVVSRALAEESDKNTRVAVTMTFTSNKSVVSGEVEAELSAQSEDILAQIERSPAISLNVTEVAETMTVTSTPSTTPSLSPSESLAPSLLQDTFPRFDITESDIDVRFDETRENEEIILNYNISSKPYNATLYGYDCQAKVEVGEEILSYSYEETPESSPSSYKNLAVKVNVHQENIQNVTNGVWVNGEPGFGKIRFCVRLDLMASHEYPVSVNFHEQKIDITVDMRTGFEVTDITTDRDESTLENKTATVDLSMNAYRCDEDDNPISNSPLSQGSILRVCIVTSDTTEYTLTEVLDFELNQDGDYGGSVTPVTNGETNSLTESSCSGNKCIIQTMMVSSFFDIRNAPNTNVEGSGKVVFDFGSKSRRKLASDAKLQITRSTDDTRNLQEGQDESSSSFRLTLQVQMPPPNKEEVPMNDDKSMAQISRDNDIFFSLMLFAVAVVSVFLFWFVVIKKKMKRNDCKEDVDSDVIWVEQKDMMLT